MFAISLAICSLMYIKNAGQKICDDYFVIGSRVYEECQLKICDKCFVIGSLMYEGCQLKDSPEFGCFGCSVCNN